jgi:hypothetical protein
VAKGTNYIIYTFTIRSQRPLHPQWPKWAEKPKRDLSPGVKMPDWAKKELGEYVQYVIAIQKS